MLNNIRTLNKLFYSIFLKPPIPSGPGKKIQLKILLHIFAGISDYGDTKKVTIACILLKNISKITAVNCNLNILAAPDLPSPERALFN